MLMGKCHCGAVGWRYAGDPVQATICNCLVCHQYGVMWIYGMRGDGIEIFGQTRSYVRADSDGDLAFHFCPTCGATHSWQPAKPEGATYRMAVNLRLAEPETVAHLPMRRFDGRVEWADKPKDGRCVADFIV